jgi:hypothetical protein
LHHIDVQTGGSIAVSFQVVSLKPLFSIWSHTQLLKVCFTVHMSASMICMKRD